MPNETVILEIDDAAAERIREILGEYDRYLSLDRDDRGSWPEILRDEADRRDGSVQAFLADEPVSDPAERRALIIEEAVERHCALEEAILGLLEDELCRLLPKEGILHDLFFGLRCARFDKELSMLDSAAEFAGRLDKECPASKNDRASALLKEIGAPRPKRPRAA